MLSFRPSFPISLSIQLLNPAVLKVQSLGQECYKKCKSLEPMADLLNQKVCECDTDFQMILMHAKVGEALI